MEKSNLMIGDWVYSEEGFPMYVTGLFEDEAYLDFKENEGDVWEEKYKDIQPIPLDDFVFDRLDFLKIEDGDDTAFMNILSDGNGDEFEILSTADKFFIVKKVGQPVRNESIFSLQRPLQSLHELQQYVRIAIGIEIADHDLNLFKKSSV